jgi:dTDP-4-amino-4,6-dideoxygalactose transaminase
MSNYKVWPIGKIPIEFQRDELDLVKKLGYNWDDPRDVVGMFEKKVAEFSGSKYACSVDSCSNGLFLALKYVNAEGTIIIPKRTYVSVPLQIIHASCNLKFEDREWSGVYQLKPYNIWDSATRWTKGMYVDFTKEQRKVSLPHSDIRIRKLEHWKRNGAIQVVSFQIKKRIPIGRGGMILTDSKEAYDWFKCMSYDGRNLDKDYMEDDFKMIGYHMYMTPEDAARGIILMDTVPEENEDSGNSTSYSDLSVKEIFTSRMED